MSNPTNAVWQFEDDLDGQGRSGPVAFTGVDPIRFDAGLWLEEGTTNYVTNPSFETNLADWFQDSGNLLERVASSLVDGAWTSRWTFDGVTTYPAGHYTAPIPATPASGEHTMVASGYVWGTGGQSMALYANIWTANYTLRYLNQEFFTPGVTPVRVSAAVSTTGGTADIDQFDIVFGEINTGLPNVNICHLDAVQMEIGSRSYPTSFCRSDMGAGYSLGANGEHIRAASSASVPMTDILNSTIGGVAFWATRQIDTGTEEYWITAGGGGSGNDLFFASLSSDRLDHKWNCDNAGVDEDNAGIDFPIDTPTFFYMAWSDIDTWTYQGGGSMQTSTRNMPTGNWGGDGTFTLQCGAGSMVVGPFMMLSRPLDDVELARLESTQNWSPSTLSPSSILLLARGRR